MSRRPHTHDHEERHAQRQFWHGVADDPAYASATQKMLLMDDAERAAAEDLEDIRELLALVPPLPPGSQALELAAGSGRVTRRLAPMVGHLTAADFVQAFCDENRAACAAAGLHHVEVVCADATHWLPPQGLDLVLANWLFMYLSDDETRHVWHVMAEALKPGGWLLFRESCDRTDEGKAHVWPPYEPENPARYRSLRWYTESLRDLDVPGTLVRAGAVLPLWSTPDWSTVQAAWLWRKG